MKLLGVTQGGFLQVFWQLCQHLDATYNYALYVSSSGNYAHAVTQFPEIADVTTLKEWDIITGAINTKPDIGRLQSLQAELPGSLWHPILADRRVYMGKLCKARQDYHPSYSEEQMLAILDVAIQKIDAFLEKEKPDMVLGFSSATFGDYLFELLAKSRNIPYGLLKGTKINNNVALLDMGIGVPQRLINAYQSMDNIPDTLRAQARSYIENVRKRGVKYEGSILFGHDIMVKKLCIAPKRLLAAYFADRKRRRDPIQSRDPHIPPSLPTAWYTNVVHPLRTFRLGRRLPLLRLEDVNKLSDFAFYPMHSEPEVALQVSGRPFQNQIEAVRTIALSLPVGTPLLVKEHPRSLGFRKESYYRKLLDIPNIRLVDPFVPSVEIVKWATLICVITGSIGLEAAIVGKPVLVLGATNYTLLPENMVQQAGNLNDLSIQISSLIKNYSRNDVALERYIAAILSISVPVNLYTRMLGKSGRYTESFDLEPLEEEYKRLAEFVSSQFLSLTEQVSPVKAKSV